ncbi:MAG: hypothetical protein LQ348_003146 [Seirophora lacunosa]|nr:MAG: hypothetical protein LQ348_003146 [Seirophora lacunosa]
MRLKIVHLLASFKIADKSVSRQHLIISVSAVKPGSGSSVHTRSDITLEDAKTKFGTVIDGQRVASGVTTVLKNDEHTYKLGNTPHTFHIKWEPVVLSVSFSSKEIKAGNDPLAALRNRLEDTDIKVINNYVIGSTTHVVQGKRNTAKGLQALINGKHIVTEAFVDALIYATTPGDLDAEESLSPLEEDFERNWPDAMQHVPPRGKEPNERPVARFAPDPDRISVFEGYTVVFCDKGQFDTLQPPITNGGGKALYFQPKFGSTTTDELVGFVKNVAGEKGLGELEDGSEGKGVVVVKFRGNSKDDFDWAVRLGTEASLALDLRFIEQNEFMDAILMNDASVLRRPLETTGNDGEQDVEGRAAIQNGTAPAVQDPQPEPHEPPPPPRRQRGLIKSRFKGFSSDEEDDKPPVSSVPHESSPHPSQPNTQPAETPSQTLVNPRKRPAPAPEEEDEEGDSNFVDQLLPAATAMKRRRLEAIEEARQRGESPPPPAPFTESAPQDTAKKATKPKAPIDIKASLRSRREAADAAIARDEESLRQEDLTLAAIENLRDLAVIEEFDIAPRPQRNGTSAPTTTTTTSTTTTNGSTITTTSRWDPAWNGRKNFKKFRRQGEGEDGGGGTTRGRRRGGMGQALIVPLEEVKNRGAAGIGQEYWLESEETLLKKRKRREQRASQFMESGGSLPPAAAAAAADDEEDEGDGSAVKREEGEGEEEEEAEGGDAGMMEDEVAEPKRRSTRGRGGAETQTQASSEGAGKGKRKAKGSVFAAAQQSDSEDDELKFRFGKRRRLQL